MAPSKAAKKAAAKRAVIDDEPIATASHDDDEPEVQQKVLNTEDLKAQVLKEMGLKVFVPEQRYFLKTQWPELDRVVGCGDKGIPYGKIIELSGPESHGKSLIQKLIMGEAQRDGAIAIHGDIEDSNDERFNTLMGVDNESLIVVVPKMVYEPLSAAQKDENRQAKAEWQERPAAWRKTHPYEAPNKLEAGELRPQSAEEIFDEIELIGKKLHAAGVEKQIWTIDSIANLTTEAQSEAGNHQNMRTNADLSMVLSGTLKQWQIKAANYNALIVLTNQIREKPGVMFGDPTYEPGGRALRHNCHSRNRVHRKGPGRIFMQGKQVGINGIITNRKNKTGEGSLENQAAEYRITWQKDKPFKDRVTFSKFVKKEKGEKSVQSSDEG